MLKITQDSEGSSVKLKLEGRLEGPWVEVLRKAWNESVAQRADGKLTVDLGAVSFADPAGRKLLIEMQKQGVPLVRATAFMRHMLTESREESD